MTQEERSISIPGESHNIDHSKQKSVNVHVSFQNVFRDTVIPLTSSKIIDEKKLLFNVSNADIYC
jgi:hypothetical protein